MFISYRAHQNISQIVQWLKGTSSRVLFQELPHLKKQSWGQHLWGEGIFRSDVRDYHRQLINKYINKQRGSPSTRTMVDFKSTPLEPIAFKARVVQ
jgi:putative transposase